MIELNGRVAIVTGASRGIGIAIAEAYHAAGASVGLIARGEEALAEVKASFGERVAAVACDVADSDGIKEAVESIEEVLGPTDILVNNAGVTRDGVLVRMSEDDWDTVMDVNLKGAFVTTKVVSRGMMKRRAGRIINITSVVGITGNRGQSNYAASKAGLIGFTKSLAKELASRNVLVNAIAPGFIETDMTGNISEEAREYLLGQIPLKKLGSVQDVANAAVFLASDLSSYITGQVLVVDGGMVM